jgi:hypothetical protein
MPREISVEAAECAGAAGVVECTVKPMNALLPEVTQGQNYRLPMES